MVKRLVVLVLAGVVLSGCVGDPRNSADAYQTRILADQTAADQAQARTMDGQARVLLLAEQEQTSAVRVAGWSRFITWLSMAGSLAVVGLAVGLVWLFVGVGRGVARLALVRSSLIPLAESTRQFPLVASYLGHGRLSLVNPNTGGVYILDTRLDGDRQLIAAAGAVQLAGAVSREARRSSDAAGVVPAVNPTVVDLAGSLFNQEVVNHERK
jgi:hypothetical protein